MDALGDLLHLSPPQHLPKAPYRRHVVFSLRPMSCWIVLQRHRSACLRTVKGAVSRVDAVLILIPTEMQPLTVRTRMPVSSYAKRISHAMTDTGVSHMTLRGQIA